MTKYYIVISDQQEGPFSLNDLKDKSISRTTMVWAEGMEDWQEAASVSDLQSLFASTPPPFQSKNVVPPPISTSPSSKIDVEEDISRQKASSQSNGSLKYVIAGVIAVAISAAVYFGVIANKGSGNNSSGQAATASAYVPSGEDVGTYTETPAAQQRELTPAELEAQLEQKELSRPLDYLTTTYDLQLNLWGDKVVVEGKIYNSASIATYQDVLLRFDFQSRTGTSLYSFEERVYEFVYPRRSAYYKFKFPKTKEIAYVNVTVIRAKPVH